MHLFSAHPVSPTLMLVSAITRGERQVMLGDCTDAQDANTDTSVTMLLQNLSAAQ
jgi:hypothetical protein